MIQHIEALRDSLAIQKYRAQGSIQFLSNSLLCQNSQHMSHLTDCCAMNFKTIIISTPVLDISQSREKECYQKQINCYRIV